MTKPALQYYLSLARSSRIELEEKKSRFIALAKPVENVEEAQGFLREQQQKYPDATHHVYAWILAKPQMAQSFSDDGEPQGTAGMPVLDVLAKQGLVQAAVIVVRYFGGIKLGAGGLVRAYSKAASQAVEEAGIVRWLTHQMYRLSSDYGLAEKLRYQLDQLGYRQEEPIYQAKVEWEVAVALGREEEFIDLVKDLTADRVVYHKGEIREFPLQADLQPGT